MPIVNYNLEKQKVNQNSETSSQREIITRKCLYWTHQISPAANPCIVIVVKCKIRDTVKRVPMPCYEFTVDSLSLRFAK